jgi:hypothetical protein
MAVRCQILRRDESVPLPNMMDKEIPCAINRALWHQQAPAHIRIMNGRRNAKGAIPAIAHLNLTGEMTMRYPILLFMAERTVDRAVMDVEQMETWEGLMIHTVPLVQYMGKGTEGLQKMREEFEADNEGIAIPTQVRWLGNPCTIKQWRQNSEMAG